MAWNQALASDMIATQAVLYEFPRLRVPTAPFIGGMDRTAPGAARAPAEIAQRLGDYPVLGRRAAPRVASVAHHGHYTRVALLARSAR